MLLVADDFTVIVSSGLNHQFFGTCGNVLLLPVECNGVRPKWKRLVTDCQIVQFVFSFAISGLMLYYHFTGTGCSGIWGWCFNAVFNASLLALFLDFHGKSYANKKAAAHKDKGL